MALIKTKIYKGFEIVDAYQKITNVNYYKVEQILDEFGVLIPINPYRLNLAVSISKSKNDQIIDSVGYNMDMDINYSGSDVTQGYAYLKTLPEFTGAVDG